jgi:hypothetical protein
MRTTRVLLVVSLLAGATSACEVRMPSRAATPAKDVDTAPAESAPPSPAPSAKIE